MQPIHPMGSTMTKLSPKWRIQIEGSALIAGKDYKLPTRTFRSREAAQTALNTWIKRVNAKGPGPTRALATRLEQISIVQVTP